MLRQQVFRYITTGALQVFIDAALLVILVYFGVTVWFGNVVSRLIAASLGFYVNKIWTFEVGGDHGYQQLSRFWVWWMAATVAGSGVLQLIDAGSFSPTQLAGIKLVLELLLAACTFIIFKFWVYKR